MNKNASACSKQPGFCMGDPACLDHFCPAHPGITVSELHASLPCAPQAPQTAAPRVPLLMRLWVYVSTCAATAFAAGVIATRFPF